ncbi:hypothetical protein M9H77_34686 [Catharanthus roseus]|uniref:Uncharacterized protein n=1 Tax=Catharanthus roseus TaxID=4058 RepID=A0ACB9ZLV6_CATRO|nr:hypothetical protein M9H77_34686 [Catharanthus roseus]
MVSRFISTNGLVEDPCGVEKERSMINPWTAEEKEIFMDKLATYGKDFKKIASFLMHKTTADCVEFYYKNHKSDCFKQTKEHSGFVKQGKAQSTNNYLVASGKRWNRECNAASLDILGAASAIAANIEVGMEIQQKCSSKYLAGLSSNCQTSRGNVAVLERSSSLDGDNTDKETVAADVLAGICGSLSSEAMGSCITSAVDPGEGYHEWKCQKVGSTSRWPPTPEVTQSIDDETCSDESCGEMDPTDWTDEEKSIFVQAVSSYGKDFTMISRCIRTRSRDQCRVFFSKARKCLGLDMICPGSGNTDVVRNEANGAGSETDDACVVEAVSHMCSVKSGVGTEDLPSPDVKLNKEPDCVVEAVSHMCSVKSGVGTEDLPSPDVKLNKEPDVAGTVTVQPDINRIEKGTGDLEHVDNAHQPMSKSDDSLVEKPELDVDGDVAMCMGPSSSRSVAVQDEGTGLASSGEVGNENTGEANDRPDRSDAEINVGAVDKVAEHHRGETDASVQGIPEIGMDVDKDDAAPSKASGRDEEVKSNPEVYTADMGSSSGCDGVSGDQQQAELETESAEQPCAIALPENSYSMPTSSASDAPVAVKCTNGLVEHTSPATNIGSTSEGGSQASRPGEQHLSKGSLMDGVESSRILKGCYLLPVSTIKQVSGDGISKRSATLQSIPKSDKNFHDDRNSSCDTYLRKCNGAKQPTSTSVSELPCQSQPQSTDNIHISSSSDSEKPHRNGDFKLFGQILVKPSSQQKATSSTQQNGNNENQHLKIGKSVVAKFSGGDQSVNGNSIQTKLVRNNFIGPENLHVRSYGGDQSVNGNSIQTKLDRNNFIGPENLPVRSYGLWNAGRTQNGFSSLPDSAMLLAKYPAAFSSFATPMEQLPLQGMNGGGERSLNGPTFAARDIDSSNGADFQVYSNREAQPFTLDVKQRQDMLLPDVQRRNGFDVVSGMQQAAGGMVGMNVGGRGGILVGGQCNSNGVSDPVAAIKMHYAQVEQFNGQAGNNIMRDDDSWRGKSNIGRLKEFEEPGAVDALQHQGKFSNGTLYSNFYLRINIR